MPFDLQWHLFNHTVTPILLYGSEVWGFEPCEAVDVFHRKFLKQQLRLKRSTPSCMIYGDTGQVKLSLMAEKRLLLFWFRMAYPSGIQSKLTHAMYKIMRHLHDRQGVEFRWGAKVRTLLEDYGMGHLWNPEDNPGVSLQWFKAAISLRIEDVFKQNWRAEVWEKSACVNYRIFKTEHQNEANLLKLEKRHAEVIFKFRCANFPLPVYENQSHTQLRLNSKECPLCHFDVGDEFHFLLVCPALRTERETLLPRYYFTNPNVIKFTQIMSSQKIRLLKSLALFLFQIKSKLSS